MDTQEKVNMNIIAETINFESDKFTNRKSDGGGPTKYGITGRTLKEWRRQTNGVIPYDAPSIAAAVQALSRNEAVRIYMENFIKKPRFGEINNFDLRHLVVDAGVLHGRHRATRWLQRVLKVKADGYVGPNTLAAINWNDNKDETREIYKKLLARRYRGFADFVQSNPSQLVFLEGWVNRANTFLLKL